MREVSVGSVNDFQDPGRKIVGFENFEVGVFRLDGEFYAYLNQCPHMGGPVCQGKMIAKVEEVIADDRTSKGMTFSKSKMKSGSMNGKVIRDSGLGFRAIRRRH